MSLSRALGWSFLALFIAVTALSAQQGGKTTPPAKPGDPKTKPGDSKTKVVIPMLPPQPPAAQGAKEKIKWPTEVNGRKLGEITKDIRNNPDPAVREASIRALPYFGPKGREEGSDELLDAMTKDLDWNVRVAAIEVAPTVLLGFAETADAPLAKGLNTMYSMLSYNQVHIRVAAITAIADVGPYMRRAEPRVVSTMASMTRDSSHWQVRRAAVAALGRIAAGLPNDNDPEKKDPPDTQAVTYLLDVLRSDHCATVRKEAVNSLLGVGPVATTYFKVWKSKLEGVLSQGNEKDKAVLLWVHVLLIRNDPNGLKGNEAHLEAVAKHLKSSEAGARLEGCQALGYLGEEASSKLQNLIDIISKETVPEVLAAAIVAVTAMPKESAMIIPILQNVQRTHPNPDVRKYAEEAVKVLTTAKKK